MIFTDFPTGSGSQPCALLEICEYIGIFPVYLRMALIFTDFPTGSGSQPCALLEICEYQSHP